MLEFCAEKIAKDSSSDLFITKCVALLMSSQVRAHEDGFYYLHGNNWETHAQMPAVVIEKSEAICKVAAGALLRDAQEYQHAFTAGGLSALLGDKMSNPAIEAEAHMAVLHQ